MKNLATLDVFNADFVGTEPKDAPYATTGEKIIAVKLAEAYALPEPTELKNKLNAH